MRTIDLNRGLPGLPLDPGSLACRQLGKRDLHVSHHRTWLSPKSRQASWNSPFGAWVRKPRAHGRDQAEVFLRLDFQFGVRDRAGKLAMDIVMFRQHRQTFPLRLFPYGSRIRCRIRGRKLRRSPAIVRDPALAFWCATPEKARESIGLRQRSPATRPKNVFASETYRRANDSN